jgi:hypothetical protein
MASCKRIYMERLRTTHTAGSTCFGPTIAYGVPHELVELELHDAFKLIQSIRK